MTLNSNEETSIEISQDLRIGVFVCYCGVNIGGFLDVPAVPQLPTNRYSEDRVKPLG